MNVHHGTNGARIDEIRRLLLHEGRSVIYVAANLGMEHQLTMNACGHVIDDLEDAPRLQGKYAIGVPVSGPRPGWLEGQRG